MTQLESMESAALLRLMQLVSPALPIGAYAYSQGLEYAVEQRWVNDEAGASEWIRGLMMNTIGQLDVPMLKRLYSAWQSADYAALNLWTDRLHACREAAQLQEEDRHLCGSLARLLCDLHVREADAWLRHSRGSFATCFSLAAVKWNIPLTVACYGYTWAWLENQVAAAIKLVPLGQTAGQRILGEAQGLIPDLVAQGLRLDDDEVGVLAPAMAIGCALHETQYSRLFRS